MKVTQAMREAFGKAVWTSYPDTIRVELEPEEIDAGIQAVLDLIGVKPFTFTGFPGNPVYLHPTCGTVVDVSPMNDALSEDVDRGECDCENTTPWLPVYVGPEWTP